MTKVIAAINMTLDGFCDHTSAIADEELHWHYTDLLKTGAVILYGRITFDLMRYWQPFVTEPSGNKDMDEFAKVMDQIPKIIFSRTLKNSDLNWKTAQLSNRNLGAEITEQKKSAGGDILIGSPSLIASASELNLVDEYQLCIHPVIAGKGLPLFKNISQLKVLNLTKTKIFRSGAVTHYYTPVKTK